MFWETGVRVGDKKMSEEVCTATRACREAGMSKGHAGRHLRGGNSQEDRNMRRKRMLEDEGAHRRLVAPLPTMRGEEERTRERDRNWEEVQGRRVSMKRLKANPFPPPSFTTLCKEADVFTVQGRGDEFTEEDTRLRFRKEGVFYDYSHSDIGQLPVRAIKEGSDALEKRGIKARGGRKVVKISIDGEDRSSHELVEVTIRPIHKNSNTFFLEDID